MLCKEADCFFMKLVFSFRLCSWGVFLLDSVRHPRNAWKVVNLRSLAENHGYRSYA